MWTAFKHWLHHLLNPHCSICDEQKAEESICRTCEILQMENARLINQNNMLIDKLTKSNEIVEISEQKEMKPIMPFAVPWSVKRAQMEQADRNRAKAIREAANSDVTDIKDLEDELLNAKVARESHGITQ